MVQIASYPSRDSILPIRAAKLQLFSHIRNKKCGFFTKAALFICINQIKVVPLRADYVVLLVWQDII